MARLRGTIPKTAIGVPFPQGLNRPLVCCSGVRCSVSVCARRSVRPTLPKTAAATMTIAFCSHPRLLQLAQDRLSDGAPGSVALRALCGEETSLGPSVDTSRRGSELMGTDREGRGTRDEGPYSPQRCTEDQRGRTDDVHGSVRSRRARPSVGGLPGAVRARPSATDLVGETAIRSLLMGAEGHRDVHQPHA